MMMLWRCTLVWIETVIEASAVANIWYVRTVLNVLRCYFKHRDGTQLRLSAIPHHFKAYDG